MGGGTVLDLGIYVIQLSQWVFQQPPKSITATGKLNSEGVDVAVEAELNYGASGIAKIATSAVKELSNVAVITGTKGQIKVRGHHLDCSKQLLRILNFTGAILLVSNLIGRYRRFHKGMATSQSTLRLQF